MNRRRLFAAALIAVPATIIGISMFPASAAVAPVANGVYTLAAGASGKCIDVAGSSTANSALLVQVACNAAAANQQWKAVPQAGGQFNLANVNSGRCIDVPSASTVSGTQLQQYGCGDGLKTNQLWTFQASAAASGQVSGQECGYRPVCE